MICVNCSKEIIEPNLLGEFKDGNFCTVECWVTFIFAKANNSGITALLAELNKIKVEEKNGECFRNSKRVSKRKEV
jgi:hypothetical protein